MDGMTRRAEDYLPPPGVKPVWQVNPEHAYSGRVDHKKVYRWVVWEGDEEIHVTYIEGEQHDLEVFLHERGLLE